METAAPSGACLVALWYVHLVATHELHLREISNPAVLRAMNRVPRQEFVPEEVREDAYADRPLPIGHEQTISQPYIVALMTQYLDPQPTDRVLEIGTGSGYQAAVLAEIVREVFTVEIVPELAESARETLRRLDYTNIQILSKDGYAGCPKHAPFHKIIVTAASENIPSPLVEQLIVGGKMILPIGPIDGPQDLVFVEKSSSGEVRQRKVAAVRFVPFRRSSQERGLN